MIPLYGWVSGIIVDIILDTQSTLIAQLQAAFFADHIVADSFHATVSPGSVVGLRRVQSGRVFASKASALGLVELLR